MKPSKWWKLEADKMDGQGFGFPRDYCLQRAREARRVEFRIKWGWLLTPFDVFYELVSGFSSAKVPNDVTDIDNKPKA